MNIVCLHSCAADGHAINNFFTKCNVDSRIVSRDIEGRYVLAYHNSQLVGVADISGETPTCVLNEYKIANIGHVLTTEIENIHKKFARKYMTKSN